jgi:hypothetical protein
LPSTKTDLSPNEDTAERKAITSIYVTKSPQTPLPRVDEDEKAEELSVAASAIKVPEEVETTQEEVPTTESDASAGEETKDVQENPPVAEDATGEINEIEAAQESSPALENELEEEVGPTAKLEDRVEQEDVTDEGTEPTAKLEKEERENKKDVSDRETEFTTELVSGSKTEEETNEDVGPNGEMENQEATTSELEEISLVGQEPEPISESLVEPDKPSIEEGTPMPEAATEEPTAVAQAEEISRYDQAAERDRIDVAETARAELAERQERVAAVDTVIVPTVMLEALVEDIPTQELEARRRDSRQLTALAPWKSPTQTLGGESRYQITGSQTALRHSVLRRWEKQGRQKKHQRLIKIISAAVIVSILVALAIPLCVGLIGYNTYTNIKGVADDGVNNLLALKALLPANKNDLLSALNTSKLAQAQTELSKAQDDFLQLQDMVNRQDIQSLLQQFAPQYSHELGMAQRLVQVALDVSRMGQELVGIAQMGAHILHGGSLLSSNSNTPLLTADDVSTIEAALVHAQYYIQDISTQMSQVNLAQIPFGSAAQKAELAKYLQLIPQAQGTISQIQNLVGPVAWLLGVGQARHFFVQTLDRGELRSSGGFEGQYGILTIQNGRMAPFSLRDITLLDYAENGAEFGATPPPQYSWMNFGNFGVRDANLSADFPTTAQLVMRYAQLEGSGPVDGVIQITPVIISQFLQITGPVYISEYHVTITAQNVENEIHAFQQDPRLIALQEQVTGTYTHSTRKSFTNELGQILLTRIKKLSPAQLLEFGKTMLKDLKTGDLQIYFTNPAAEQWLTQNGDSGSMPNFTNGTDGFMVVQSNVSISKASQYVHSTFQDQVQLQQGGALHNLTITLNYQQTGPVYGFNTYADYLRVYAPPNAQLINAYGFDTGQTLCTSSSKSVKPPKPSKGSSGSGGGTVTDTSGSYVDNGITIYGCGSYYHTSPDSNYRYCSDGNYELGYDGMAGKPWPIQMLGGPSANHSDLPGYAMWGGMTLTPMNCTSTITLEWFVPNVIHNTPGQPPYQMIVGHQAGWPDSLQVSINASALKGVKSLSYNQTIDTDTLIALANRPLPPTQKPPTTPTPAATPTATPKKH